MSNSKESKQIVVTGGYGSGKSSVSKMLTTVLDCHFVSADVVCRELMLVGAEGWSELRDKWSSEFFLKSGELDRNRVRETIFTEPQMKEELENILHPLVKKRIEQEGLRSCQRGKTFLVEIPLFFESKQSYNFNAVVVVATTEKVAIARGMKRDGINEDVARRILASQVPLSIKKTKADFVINNDGLFAATYSQVLSFAYQL